MNADDMHAVPKVHPTSREILPDDPLEIHGFEIAGDPMLMLRMLVEEYARLGWGVEAIVALARDPNFQAFHGLWRQLGEDELRRRIHERLSRCGIFQVKTIQREPFSECLVQIELPA